MTQLNSSLTPETASIAPSATPATSAVTCDYQAPAIESVVTSDAMAREVFYAGTAMTVPDPPIGP